MSGLFDRLDQELQAREKACTLTMMDVLTLPDDLRKLFTWIMCQEEVGLADVIAHVGQGEPAARALLAALVEQCFLREIRVGSEMRYRVRLTSDSGREVPLNIWQALCEKTEKGEDGR